MKILLVYSSRTGNTKKVAEAIGEELGIPAVPVEEKPAAADFDLVIAGFWVDRSTADAKMKAYLESLREVRVKGCRRYGFAHGAGNSPDADGRRGHHAEGPRTHGRQYPDRGPEDGHGSQHHAECHGQ